MVKLICAHSDRTRSAAAVGLSLLLVTAAGCGASDQGQSSFSDNSSSPSLVLSSSSASVSSEDTEIERGDSAVSDSDRENASSQDQQTVLNQTRAALNTKGTEMLPAARRLPISVPVTKGCSLTATTSSQPTHYQVKFCETSQPVEIDSPAASKGTLIATVEGIQYKNAASANENISGYEKVDASNSEELFNLGHNIKAVGDAGTGHKYLTWNEGRWCIKVDSPIDPAFQNKEYPDGKQLARNIVAYLEDHTLPAPQKIGVIQSVIWNQSYEATVQWQENQMVYQVTSEDPMTALKVAVAMK